MNAITPHAPDAELEMNDACIREMMILKGERDFRSAIVSMVQAQSMMFAYATERNIFDTVQHFVKLENEIRNIGKESANIKQILLKTRILSINASVEAARVGNAGKGFGIVAGEIGSLSNQTETCTDEVEKISRTLSEEARFSSSTLVKLNKDLSGFAKASSMLISDTLKLVAIEDSDFVLTLLAHRLVDHANFMRKLIINIGTHQKLGDHHSCAFGKWYDQNEKKYRHLPAFKDIYQTHKSFHTTAIEFDKTMDIGALTRLVTFSSEIMFKFDAMYEAFIEEMKTDFSFFDV